MAIARDPLRPNRLGQLVVPRVHRAVHPFRTRVSLSGASGTSTSWSRSCPTPRRSLNADGTLATDPTFARLDYALTDRNFSVIGTGFTSGEVGDRVRYDPYGTFQAFPAGDVNRDGAVNSGDTTAIMFASGYQADLDVNMDGAVDSKDSGVVSKLRGRSLGAGELSDRGNIVGWCGYLYEEATGMWLARHRWQIPELGRWANRDPIGYAGGGQNLYEYVNGNPVVLQDPSGLIGGFFDMIGEGFQQAKSDIGNLALRYRHRGGSRAADRQSLQHLRQLPQASWNGTRRGVSDRGGVGRAEGEPARRVREQRLRRAPRF